MISIDEINMLQSQNKGLKKQNGSLQKELKELRTKYSDILKLVKEPADSVAVLELQTRILRVLKGDDGNKIKRSECEGIDCAWCTEDCE